MFNIYNKKIYIYNIKKKEKSTEEQYRINKIILFQKNVFSFELGHFY